MQNTYAARAIAPWLLPPSQQVVGLTSPDGQQTLITAGTAIFLILAATATLYLYAKHPVRGR